MLKDAKKKGNVLKHANTIGASGGFANTKSSGDFKEHDKKDIQR